MLMSVPNWIVYAKISRAGVSQNFLAWFLLEVSCCVVHGDGRSTSIASTASHPFSARKGARRYNYKPL